MMSDLFLIIVFVLIIVYTRRRMTRQAADVAPRRARGPEAEERLAQRLVSLERRVAKLEAMASGAQPTGVEAPAVGAAEVAAAEPETAAYVPTAEPAAAELPTTGTPRRTLEEIVGIRPSPAPAPTESRAAVRESVMSRLRSAMRHREFERHFIENWTGILGAVVVVAGVTFIGIYTALRLDPFYRFLLTLAAAAAFLAASHVLARKDPWRAFAAWLRSAGAAIVLFACAAAGGLPGLGLQWIHGPAPALALLVAGIAANLYIAHAAGTQVFATLHVLLSLLPLAIVPATTTALAIASAVAAFGVGLAAQGRWDRHLAIVLGTYVVFHALWFAGMGERLEPHTAGLIAAGCATIVFVAAALVHYRKDYAQVSPPPLQLGVHLANWGLLAFATFVYVPGAIARGATLLVFAVLAYRLGRRALGLRVAWLHRADTLTAQAFVVLALLSAYRFGATDSLLLLVVLVETLAFRWLLRRGEDEMLDRVANMLPIVPATLLVIAGPADILAHPDERLGLAAIILAGAVTAALGSKLLEAQETLAPEGPGPVPRREWLGGSMSEVLAFLSGPLLLVSLAAIIERPWMETAALVAVGALLFLLRRAGRPGLLAAAYVAVIGAHALSWDYLVLHQAWSAVALAPRIAALLGLAALTVWISGPGVLRLAAIGLVGADLGLAAFLFTDPVSPLIPGVAWLLMSLAALEVANRLRERESLTVLGIGYAYLVAFALAYALVIVQAPAYIGTWRARALIELFAIGVLAYWWFFRPRDALAGAVPWTHVHPLFFELIFAAIAVTVVVEVSPLWWSVAWAVIALLLLAPPVESLLDARARIYSLLFYWVSVIDMAVVMSTLEVPSRLWYRTPEFTSLVAIVLQVVYVVIAHRRLVLAGIEPPAPVRVLGRLGAVVASRRNLYVYYPLFAGIALFLYRRFDHSVLTLLWAAEAFVVFGLSAWLRENQFRYVALAGLAACLVRLVLIDMAEANLALRGAVFIGVGLLMLGMNAIYNRYRARFET